MFDFWKRMDKRSQRTMLICFYAFCCNGTLSMLMGSMMPDLQATYGITDTMKGLFISAHSVGNLIAGFISGLVPLWLGRKRSIMVLAALAFIGYGMTLVIGWPAWLFVAFLLVGMGRGSVTNFDNRMSNLLTHGSPVSTNLLHASFAVGAISMPMLFLVLRNAFSWRAGVILVLVLGVTEFLLFNTMRLDDDHPSRSDRKNSTMVFLKNPSFLIFCGMMFCYLCSEYTLNGWLVTYIQSKQTLVEGLEKAGMTMTAFSQTMATLLWTVMLIGRLICAWLSGRFSQKKLMLISSVGMCGFFVCLMLSRSIGMVVFSVATLGLCMAGICPMIYSDAAIFTNTYPMATSALLAIGSIGAIVMPTIVGALAEHFGFFAGMGAILVTIVLLLVFALLNVVIKPHLPQENVNNF